MVFEEKQTMGQVWWVLLPLPITFVFVFTAWFKETEPTEKADIFSAMLILLAVGAAVFGLLLLMQLSCRIDNDGVTVRYFPFIRKRLYRWQDIQRIYVRKYKPIGEFGGWGIKSINLKKNGLAYNVWGNKGLQLQLYTGKKLLIGTQKAHEMADFLKLMKKQWDLPQIEDPQLNG